AIAMKMKNIDFKDIMLRYGEKIGLGVAGALGGLMLISGLWSGLASKSSGANAKVLVEKTKTENARLHGSAGDPTEPEKLAEADPKLLQQAKFSKEDADAFRVTASFFEGRGQDDTKRRRPKILAPDEFKTAVALAQFRAFIVSPDLKKVMV